ncbi:hypothetical protein [Anabaena lutea]|nr:hypothetical protein [Anabaena lutea]
MYRRSMQHFSIIDDLSDMISATGKPEQNINRLSSHISQTLHHD